MTQSQEFKIKPIDVVNVIQGNVNHLADKINLLKPHITEQAEYRKILCAPCVANGKCLICKCPCPKMMYAPNKTCPDKKWMKMTSPEDWTRFKTTDDYIKRNEPTPVSGDVEDGSIDSRTD